MGKLSSLQHLEKKGKGRRAYWKVAEFSDPLKELSFDIGLRLNNDRLAEKEKNYFQLNFVKDEKRVVGFMLLEVLQSTCAFRGMKVNELERGKGLSNIFFAIWLKICAFFSVTPQTNLIDKPVLSLILLRFGFLPKSKTYQVEIANDPKNDGGMILWLPPEVKKRKTSMFSNRSFKNQNIRVVEEKPDNSTTVFVGTRFETSDENKLQSLVQSTLQGKLRLSANAFKVNFCSPVFFQSLNWNCNDSNDRVETDTSAALSKLSINSTSTFPPVE